MTDDRASIDEAKAAEAPGRPDRISQPPAPDTHNSRLELVWRVFVFQFKLAFDGLRDLLLVPLSLSAALLGLIAGGDAPDRYFKQLLRFGRRTEHWLNLFGHHRHGETSDKLIEPLQQRVLDGARSNPWVSRKGTELNRRLDEVNASVAERRRRKADE